MALLDDIRDQFPYLAFLINDPEVGQLLREAVDPNVGYSPERFQAKLLSTNWWTSRSQSMREWDILANTDPGEAQSQRSLYMTTLYHRAHQMGTNLTPDEVWWFTEFALRNGIDINHPRITEGLASIALQPGRGRPGGVSTARDQVKWMSNHEWMLPMTEEEENRLGSEIAMGIKSLDDINQMLSDRAKYYYPHLYEELNRGQSMQQIFSGHIATIGEELELSPSQINLRNEWGKVIDTYDPDPNVKQHRPMTLSETRTLARQDDRFWKTANGQALDSSLTNNILQQFGVRR